MINRFHLRWVLKHDSHPITGAYSTDIATAHSEITIINTYGDIDSLTLLNWSLINNRLAKIKDATISIDSTVKNVALATNILLTRGDANFNYGKHAALITVLIAAGVLTQAEEDELKAMSLAKGKSQSQLLWGENASLTDVTNSLTDGGYSLRTDSLTQVNIDGESSNSENTYTDKATVDTAVDATDPKDGLEIIDLEQPIGSAPSLMLWKRASTW